MNYNIDTEEGMANAVRWADLDEAGRVGRIFARKNRCYQYE